MRESEVPGGALGVSVEVSQDGAHWVASPGGHCTVGDGCRVALPRPISPGRVRARIALRGADGTTGTVLLEGWCGADGMEPPAPR